MIEDADRSDSWAAPRADWGVARSDEKGRWSFWKKDFVNAVSQVNGIKGAMAMGTVLAIELQDSNAGEYGRCGGTL
jgi:dethiobiotin synthetase/adenosylmethionine--8-amino-7-oxononanoate aminotransferase